MNLKHLEHWLALAETGSFSRAAEKLHITQSALSRSIQVLEEDLGGPLVDRVGKKNELTPLGLSVLERARRIVHEAQELRQGAALLQQGGLGSLRVGLGSGPGAMLMTPWLRYMAEHHPTVQVSVSRGSTELQLTQLRERQLDALVVDVRRVDAARDLNVAHVVEMRAGFVCRQGHPLLGLYPEGAPFNALLAYPIASIPLSQEVARLLVDHYGPQANPAQMTTLQCEDIASLLDVVGQTDAIYLGIVGAAREGMTQGVLMELPMQMPLQGQARLGLITLVGRTELPALAVFREFVQKHMTD
ncbi:LysR family transcriptional regulator [Limnohabitans sp. Bal53]|uniref:LysR family transcriptional regulator n=1 Tax=Limnohabitans sp. Bal53 TaxID=1977910 RepID=UPI000D3983BD|nr:LysR family transcriptional regulator [Limnohabitans sp. Bal53]PUE40078.1 LysR family transcriptional regulator [Limnohabitans sp. Bal53]